MGVDYPPATPVLIQNTPLTEDLTLDLIKIKQVVDLMKKSDLSEFEIHDQDFKLRIKRDVPGKANPAPPALGSVQAPAAPAPAPAPAPAQVAALAAVDPSIKLVTSPMVGTYYSTPSPENPPFVTVGSPIKADSVVCIIEAMKVMNEIQSEISGTVVECLVAIT